VIDADAVGHQLLKEPSIQDQVVSRFGSKVLTQKSIGSEPGVAESAAAAVGEIDRRALGAIVFADPEALRSLEAILHPAMRRRIEETIAAEERRGEVRAIVLDAAILLEAGWNTLCDRILFVDAPRDQRLARLIGQRGWTAETLEARERAQWDLERKRRQADLIIVNDSTPERLETQMDRLWATEPGIGPDETGTILGSAPAE
jgi:dephospho-CoA kinase